MFNSVKIRSKHIISLLAATIITAVIILTVNHHIQSETISVAQENALAANFRQLENSLKSEANRAVSLADLVAGISSVQDAFARRDRDALAEHFAAGFVDLKNAHGVRQFQFHLPPATSFLRVHKMQKFGDDISSFRKTVTETNERKTRISGLEVGMAGLGMRGVTPVFHNGAHIGSVEFGLSFGQPFFDGFTENTSARS